MKKLLAFLLLCPMSVYGQGLTSMFPGPGTVHSAGGGGYTGPGDIVGSASAYWGLRAYSAATRGNNAIQACNAADANCVDIATDATTGALKISTTNVGASPCNDSTNICTIKIWDDQTGNGRNLTQATIANRETLVVNCAATLPCARAGANTDYTSAGTYVQAQPFTETAVGSRNGGTGERYILVDKNSQSVKFVWSNGVANQVQLYAGSAVNLTASDNAFHSVTGVFNNASSITGVDATVNTGQNLSSFTWNDTVSWICFSGCGGSSQSVDMREAGIWPSGFTSGNVTSLNANQKSYWGY